MAARTFILKRTAGRSVSSTRPAYSGCSKVLRFLTCFFLLTGFARAEVDTCGLILPALDYVITGDMVKLSVPGILMSDTVRQVAFHVRYSQYASNKMSHAQVDTVLAVDSVPPFETVWECAGVPDQDNRNLLFYFTVVNSRGRVVEDGQTGLNRQRGETFTRRCAIDRHPDPPEKIWRCPYEPAPVTVDGDLTEWDGQAPVTFTNNDNRITARARWNRDCLYFAVRVDDGMLFPGRAAGDTLDAYMKDGVELFLDLNHTRASIRDHRDIQFIVPVAGKPLFVCFDSDAGLRARPGPPDYPLPGYAVRTDSAGYRMELLLAWADYGLVPRSGMALGINLVNSDREGSDGVIVTNSWAGISDLCHHNPAQWGTLRLTRDRTALIISVAGLVMLLLAGAVFRIRQIRKKRIRERNFFDTDLYSCSDAVIERVRAHLQSNITRSDKELLNSAAALVELSPDYLRQYFKKVTSRSLHRYINHLRVERAQQLLVQTDMAVTDITSQAGFGSYQAFNQVFRKAAGCSPGHYREQRRH